ncbi:MAG: alternate-type signal peptide domain-containing protein [Cellulomonadaceae bacterium]|jgi:alternate signal-mediated exported protein|nr:alternate-type signal peptide domain-containing protein [Cellulomonadaceae bacterium]
MKHNKKFHSKIAALTVVVASSLLVAGAGTTLALWSAQEHFTAGTITAGTLEITGTQVGIWDVSPDRIGGQNVGVTSDLRGRPITDLAAWRKVPGDTIMFRLDATPVLRGDNLVATLTIDGLTQLIETAHQIPGTFEVSVARAGQYLLPRVNIADLATNSGSVNLGNWSPAASGIANTIEIDPAHPNVEVRVFATFDRNTTNRDAVNAVNQLAGMSVGLHQVRSGSAHFITG